MLHRFAAAVARESHVLRGGLDPAWQRLCNRLQWEKPPIPELLAVQIGTRSRRGAPWLRSRWQPRGESIGLTRTLLGHTGPVLSCAISRDSAWIVSTSEDETVRLWEVATGKQVARLIGHRGPVAGGAISPDGSLLASAGADGTVRLWDLGTGTERARFGSPDLLHAEGRYQDVAKDCAFTPDGSMLITAGSDGAVWVWDLATGELRGGCSPSEGGLCAICPEGTAAVWATGDGLHVFRVPSIQNRGYVAWKKAELQGCAISPTGSPLALWTRTGELILADTESEWLTELEGHEGTVDHALFSADGSLLVVSGTRAPEIWEVSTTNRPTAQPWGTLDGHTARVRACAVSSDGKLAVSASDDQTLCIWELARVMAPFQETEGRLDRVRSVGFSRSGSQALALRAGGYREHLEIRDLPTGQRWILVEGEPDSAVVWVGWDRALAVSQVPLGEELAKLAGTEEAPRQCAISRVEPAALSPNGSFVVAPGDDCCLFIWDLARGRQRAQLAGHGAAVTACAISPEGSFVVSASEDETLRIWDLPTDERRRGVAAVGERAKLEGHRGEVTGCAISPDGSFLVSTGRDETARIWDVATAAERARLELSAFPRAAISPDGTFVVAAGLGALRVWDVEQGRERLALEGHTHTIRDLAITPDGRYVVSTSTGDKTLRVWDVLTGTERARVFNARGFYKLALHPVRELVLCVDEGWRLQLLELDGIDFGPLVLTAVDRGAGPEIRCPVCGGCSPVTEGQLGHEVRCPQPACLGRLRINPFVVRWAQHLRRQRPSRRRWLWPWRGR